MMITETMEKYYADLLKRNVISEERLLSFILEREDCSFDEAREIKYAALYISNEEV